MATKTLKWVGPTTYTDGSPFGNGDLAGWEIVVDGQPAVNVPAAWHPDNNYEYELELGYGTHTVTVATVASNGSVSEPSAPLTFTIEDDRVPNPPTSLRVE